MEFTFQSPSAPVQWSSAQRYSGFYQGIIRQWWGSKKWPNIFQNQIHNYPLTCTCCCSVLPNQSILSSVHPTPLPPARQDHQQQCKTPQLPHTTRPPQQSPTSQDGVACLLCSLSLSSPLGFLLAECWYLALIARPERAKNWKLISGNQNEWVEETGAGEVNWLNYKVETRRETEGLLRTKNYQLVISWLFLAGTERVRSDQSKYHDVKSKCHPCISQTEISSSVCQLYNVFTIVPPFLCNFRIPPMNVLEGREGGGRDSNQF